jgi:hypothetical protein
MRLAHTLLILGFLAGPPAPDRAGDKQPSGAAPAAERLQFTAAVGPMVGAARIDVEALPPTDPETQVIRLLATVEAGTLISTFYPFFYRHISSVSGDRLLPRTGSRQIQEAGQQWFIAFSYRHGEREVRLARSAGGTPYARDPVAVNTHDLLSALYHLRALDPSRAAEFTVYENRRLYRISARPAVEESVAVPAGTFPAWHRVLHVDPAGEQLIDPRVHVWISRGPEHLPLRLTASTFLGEMALELVTATSSSPPGASGSAGD